MAQIGNEEKLRAIAAKVGVSRTTVARVLGQRRTPVYRPACRRAALIHAEARRLKYRPNMGGRALQTGRFNAVTLLLGQHETVIFYGMLDGIHDALARRDYHLNLGRIPESETPNIASVPKVLREMISDGLLISYMGLGAPAWLVQGIDRFAIPCVWINFKRERDCVYPDDIGGAGTAVRHLLETGHRRICYLGPPVEQHYSRADRLQGYRDAMLQAGATPEAVLADDVSAMAALRAHFGKKRNPELPTAVLSYGPDHSVAILQAAAERGLTVPRDLSVVQFAEKIKPIAGLRLTTALLPWYDIGGIAAGMLLERLERPRRHFEPRAFTVHLVQADSCAPPSR